MDTPPSTLPPSCKGGELSEGRRIAIAVQVALAIPPGKVRVPKDSMLTDTFFYPASVLVLVWSPKCLGFSVGPPSVLVLVWGQYYTGFSIGGSDMDTWGLG